MKPQIITISGPSGVGKTTMAKTLVNKYPDLFEIAVSYTTRPPRPIERIDIDYLFRNRKYVEEMWDKESYFTKFEFCDNLYFLNSKTTKGILDKNKIPICVISSKTLNLIGDKSLEGLVSSIFLMPKEPWKENLESNLSKRGEKRDIIEERLHSSGDEIKYGIQNASIIVNSLHNLKDDLVQVESVLRGLGILFNG